MKEDFNIGDKVMVDFGKWGEENWGVDTIIGETKTLWKCKGLSFKKDYPNTVRGYSDSWHSVYAIPFNEERYKTWKNTQKIEVDFSYARNRLAKIESVEQKISFITWVKENLGE